MPYGQWKNKDRFVDPHGRYGTIADADAGCVRAVYDDGKRALLSPDAVAELRPTSAPAPAVACELCGTPTPMLGTKRCNPCWEAERQIERIAKTPKLAAAMLRALAQQLDQRTEEEICEWCEQPVNNGESHGEGNCFEDENR